MFSEFVRIYFKGDSELKQLHITKSKNLNNTKYFSVIVLKNK